MSKRGLGEKIKLSSYEEMFGTEDETAFEGVQGKEGQVVEIPLSDLHTFKNHPFRVVDDETWMRWWKVSKSMECLFRPLQDLEKREDMNLYLGIVENMHPN